MNYVLKHLCCEVCTAGCSGLECCLLWTSAVCCEQVMSAVD